MKLAVLILGLCLVSVAGCNSQPDPAEVEASEMMAKWPPERVADLLRDELELKQVTVTKRDSRAYEGKGIGPDGSNWHFTILLEKSGLHMEYTSDAGGGGMMSFGGDEEGY